MRFLLPSLLVLCAVVAAQQSSPKTSPTNRSQQHEQPNSKNIPSIPAPSSASPEVNIQIKAPSPEQKTSNWKDWFWPPEWANWALVVVGIWAAWIALGTLEQIKQETAHTGDFAQAALRQAKATEDQLIETQKAGEEARQAAIFSRKATRESQRADVLIESISIVAGNQNWTQNGGGALAVRFKNFGRTRANDVILRVELTVPNTILTQGKYELPSMVLGKGQDQTITTDTFYNCLGLPIFNQIIKGQKEMRFTAFASYDDVFGDSYTTMDIGVFDTRTDTFKIQQKIAG